MNKYTPREPLESITGEAVLLVAVLALLIIPFFI